MLPPVTRRVALSAASAALITCAVASGSPVGAVPAHPTVPATTFLFGSLDAVTIAPHSSDAWAIGLHGNGTGEVPYAIHRHNGHWSSVAIKAPGGAGMTGVAAGSAKSIWAVGSSENTPIIEHSTGGAFTHYATKLPGGYFNAVSASSTSNAWAVGTLASGGVLVAHWNGHSWKRVPAGSLGKITPLAVSTTSASNVWILPDTGHIARWNGHKFTREKALGLPRSAHAVSIATASASNTWVVASDLVTGKKAREKILASHWNGHSWKRVSVPSPYTNSSPASIAIHGSHAYIAGAGNNTKASSHTIAEQAFALRLSGRKWKREHVSQPGKYAGFVAVATSSKATVTVGVWSSTAQCPPSSATCPSGTKPLQALAEGLHGSSWHKESTPKLRSHAILHISTGRGPQSR